MFTTYSSGEDDNEFEASIIHRKRRGKRRGMTTLEVEHLAILRLSVYTAELNYHWQKGHESGVLASVEIARTRKKEGNELEKAAKGFGRPVVQVRSQGVAVQVPRNWWLWSRCVQAVLKIFEKSAGGTVFDSLVSLYSNTYCEQLG